MERWIDMQAAKYLVWYECVRTHTHTHTHLYTIWLKSAKDSEVHNPHLISQNKHLPHPTSIWKKHNSTWVWYPASPVTLRRKKKDIHTPCIVSTLPVLLYRALKSPFCQFSTTESTYYSKMLTLLVPKRHTTQHCWVVSFLIIIFMILPLSAAFGEMSWR